MRAGALLALLLALPGCAVFRRELPPWARPTPATASSPASPSSGSGGSDTGPGTPATGAAAGLTPGGSVQSPAPPPVPPPASAGPPAGPPPAPSPPLTASLPPAEVRRLQDDAQRQIEQAERLLRQIEGRPFAPKDLETLRLAQSLVEQARKALEGEEHERAANLAAKARTLADDLRTQR